MNLYTVYMQKEMFSFEELFWPVILPLIPLMS